MMLPLCLSDYRQPRPWNQETIFRWLIRIHLRRRLQLKQYVQWTTLSCQKNEGEKWAKWLITSTSLLTINNTRIIKKNGSGSSFTHNHMWNINGLLWFSIMSHLSYSNCKCLLYQINISSFNMIRPSSSVSPLWGSSLILDSSLLRDIMICLWPKSTI